MLVEVFRSFEHLFFDKFTFARFGRETLELQRNARLRTKALKRSKLLVLKYTTFEALPRSQLFSLSLPLKLLGVCTQHLLHAAVSTAESVCARAPCNSCRLPNKIFITPTGLILADAHDRSASGVDSDLHTYSAAERLMGFKALWPRRPVSSSSILPWAYCAHA